MIQRNLAPVPVPFPNSYWVLPGKFLAGEYPRTVDPEYSLRKIRSILDAGILRFIDLTEEGERNWRGKPLAEYQSLMQNCCNDAARVRHPIPDNSIVPEKEIKRILDDIDKFLFEKTPLYVHCWGGHGRTGLIVGCWLARHGIVLGEDVFLHLRSLRTGMPDGYRDSPETETQREVVRSWQKEICKIVIDEIP